MYETTSIIILLIFYVFQGYCLQYFYSSFLERRIHSDRLNGFVIASLFSSFMMVMYEVESPESGDYRLTVVKLILSLCVLCIIALCFYKAFCPITAFLVVTFQAVADLSRYLTAILFSKINDGLFEWLNSAIENEAVTSDKDINLLINCFVIGGLFLEYTVMACLICFSLKKIVSYYKEKDHEINSVELMFILVPSSVGLMICMLLRIIMISAEDGVPKLLYEKYPVLSVVIPAILLLSLISILCGIRLFQDMICRNRERSDKVILERQIQSMQEHIEEMERIYSGIRGMKHDMKNTLSVIQRLSAGNSAEENVKLQAYLSELNQSFEKLEVRFKTGNTVVDTLLNMKYHEAVSDMPDLKMDADELLLPRELNIHSYDIGVILGNAVDNAIEACRKLKAKEPEADAFIRLCSLQKGNLLIMKVENSFDGRLVQRSQDEFPITDKADKKSHGIGLANIKSTAEKYQGTMDFRIKDRVFILSVMMKNERSM